MAILGAFALLVFGPEQLPRVARKAGNVMREIQNTSQSFIREMERAADVHDAEEARAKAAPEYDPLPYDAAAYDAPTVEFPAVGEKLAEPTPAPGEHGPAPGQHAATHESAEALPVVEHPADASPPAHPSPEGQHPAHL